MRDDDSIPEQCQYGCKDKQVKFISIVGCGHTRRIYFKDRGMGMDGDNASLEADQ